MDEVLAYRRCSGRAATTSSSDGLEPVRDRHDHPGADGRVSTTDGPFAETKEQLGGFMLIEARDLNDAIRVAARIPPVRLGCVEIRPLREHAARAGVTRIAREP